MEEAHFLSQITTGFYSLELMSRQFGLKRSQILSLFTRFRLHSNSFWRAMEADLVAIYAVPAPFKNEEAHFLSQITRGFYSLELMG